MQIFKTREFARLARKQSVGDAQLREAIDRAERGLIDAAIGRFLIKQRVARQGEGRSGGFRTIVFYRQGNWTLFLHMFAKNEQGNLTIKELAAYREFAKHLSEIKADQIGRLVERGSWLEI